MEQTKQADNATEKPATPEEIADRNNRSFTQFLAGLEYGALLSDLQDHKTEIIEALNEHRAAYSGKPAAVLNLKLTFQLDDNMVDVKSKIDVTLPEYKRGKTSFFVTSNNDLSRSDPRQRDMFAGPKSVDKP